MITKSRMTIDLYLKQAGIKSSVENKNFIPIKPFRDEHFGQTLEAFTSADNTNMRARAAGKTISEYMANRVPANRAFTALNLDIEREVFQAAVSKHETRREAETAAPKTEKAAKIDHCIKAAAEKYNLSESLIKNLIQAESGFRTNAVSPAGAKGLMQLMPGTARAMGVTDSFDIQQNIDGGAKYLRQMLDRFNGDIKLALAAYNAGPGTVERYNRNIPPYRETRNYVQRVLSGLSTEDTSV